MGVAGGSSVASLSSISVATASIHPSDVPVPQGSRAEAGKRHRYDQDTPAITTAAADIDEIEVLDDAELEVEILLDGGNDADIFVEKETDSGGARTEALGNHASAGDGNGGGSSGGGQKTLASLTPFQRLTSPPPSKRTRLILCHSCGHSSPLVSASSSKFVCNKCQSDFVEMKHS